jgi:hypothetical protein
MRPHKQWTGRSGRRAAFSAKRISQLGIRHKTKLIGAIFFKQGPGFLCLIWPRRAFGFFLCRALNLQLREATMSKCVCALYGDPAERYPRSRTRDSLPEIKPARDRVPEFRRVGLSLPDKPARP